MTKQTVVITTHEGVQELDAARLVDVINEANNFLAEEDRYEIALVAAHLNSVCTSNKM